MVLCLLAKQEMAVQFRHAALKGQEMDLISFFSSLAIYAIAFGVMTFFQVRKCNALKREHKAYLKSLREKSQLEQDLSLATTEQLMNEVQGRVPGFILITPNASNVQNEQGMNVHIKGLPPQAAISCMKFACQVIATNAPPDFSGGIDFEHEE